MSEPSLEEMLGITRTVYSWVMPETERLLRELAGPPHREVLRDRHREAWTSKQDAYHEEFFETWLGWCEAKVRTPAEFAHRYPTAGSSEGIRETLATLASSASCEGLPGPPTIHIFEGEYEGYRALARPYGIRVVDHPRESWRESLLEYRGEASRGHRFYLSQPSSIDGNLWGDFDEFLDFLGDHTEMRVMLDLCYVGCVPDECYPDARIAADHEVVDVVFFSLSKVFGTYYHRIGGMFSREEYYGLWGNKWFKNLTSLYLGTELMRRYGVTELPDKYRPLQQTVVEELSLAPVLVGSEGAGIPVASDVFLLAGHQGHSPCNEFDRLPGRPRYCLTRRMYEKCWVRGDYLEGVR